MSSHDAQVRFLVNPHNDPIVLRISGRATYLNCGPLSDFFERLISTGKSRFVLDFSECLGVDSTFLGLIAAAVLNLRKKDPSGVFTFCNLSARNLELVQNLGLHRLVKVETAACSADFNELAKESLTAKGPDQVDSKTILKAHESLVQADSGNAEKFEDVISFLKSESQG